LPTAALSPTSTENQIKDKVATVTGMGGGTQTFEDLFI